MQNKIPFKIRSQIEEHDISYIRMMSKRGRRVE